MSQEKVDRYKQEKANRKKDHEETEDDEQSCERRSFPLRHSLWWDGLDIQRTIPTIPIRREQWRRLTTMRSNYLHQWSYTGQKNPQNRVGRSGSVRGGKISHCKLKKIKMS